MSIHLDKKSGNWIADARKIIDGKQYRNKKSFDTKKEAKTFETDVGQPLLKQACSAFSEDGRVVFHEDVYRSGSVSFNLSQSNRSPRHVGVNPK